MATKSKNSLNLRAYLMPYQRAYVDDRSRFKIWVAARQVGKSTGVSFETVDRSLSEPNTNTMVVSASERQSLELMQRVGIWADALEAAAPGIIDKRTLSELHLANGSRIISLPANPKTVRAFSGHIVLDEFAFHEHPEKIWAAVYPIATRGYSIRITSTPNGRNNMFHEIWERGGAQWSRHITPIGEAIRQGLPIDLQELRAGISDPEIWAQEYECRFLDEATAFLTFDLIEGVEDDAAGLPAKKGDGFTYIGADIGRRRDLTVFWVLEAVGDVFWTREVAVLQGERFARQDAVLDRLVTRYKPQRICLDQSGMGEKVVEDAAGRYGRRRVEGVLFTGPAKLELAMGLRRRFEDRSVRIPRDEAVREDLHRVRKVVTSSGNIRFDAERTQDGHADRFWALALAVHASGQPATMPKVTSRGKRNLFKQIQAEF
jgi:phage FluMu gp28-like protein